MKKSILILLTIVLALPNLMAQDEMTELSFKRNNLSLMLSDVVFRRGSFEYEHVFGTEGNLAINIPFSVSFGDFNDVYDEQVHWWVGLGIKMYPTGQGKIRYFLGPEVRVISATDEYVYSDYIYYEGYAEEITCGPEDYIHTAFLLNNGMIYEPVDHFIFGVTLGLGFVARDQKSDTQFLPMATPSVRMGIRF